MNHPINRYCKKRKITRAELARRSKLSPQFLADVVVGRRFLGRKSALAIVEATNGDLSLDELLMPSATAA
jgi:hypothetical protein